MASVIVVAAWVAASVFATWVVVAKQVLRWIAKEQALQAEAEMYDSVPPPM